MAKKSGRRSAADLSAARYFGKIEPTRKLSAAGKRAWNRVLNAWPHDHWVTSDAELLTQYCAVCAAFEKAGDDLAQMERAGRLALFYATRLRISPQSRFDARAAGRGASNGRSNGAAASSRLIASGPSYEGGVN